MQDLKIQLIQYIERMDETQLNIAIGFFKALFGFHD